VSFHDGMEHATEPPLPGVWPGAAPPGAGSVTGEASTHVAGMAKPGRERAPLSRSPAARRAEARRPWTVPERRRVSRARVIRELEALWPCGWSNPADPSGGIKQRGAPPPPARSAPLGARARSMGEVDRPQAPSPPPTTALVITARRGRAGAQDPSHLLLWFRAFHDQRYS
jgi:hypothetical protein